MSSAKDSRTSGMGSRAQFFYGAKRGESCLSMGPHTGGPYSCVYPGFLKGAKTGAGSLE